MSTIGKTLKMTIFGESHGPAIGVTLDSLPAGYRMDEQKILTQMARRAPGDPSYGTSRKEPDLPEVLSGLLDGVTTGFPICAVIRNTNTRSGDYQNLLRIPRPGHADYTAAIKYGGAADMRGGGHFSGRLTAPLVYAGALCRQILGKKGVVLGGHVASLGGISDTPLDPHNPAPALLARLSEETFPVIDPEAKQRMIDRIFEKFCLGK